MHYGETQLYCNFTIHTIDVNQKRPQISWTRPSPSFDLITSSLWLNFDPRFRLHWTRYFRLKNSVEEGKICRHPIVSIKIPPMKSWKNPQWNNNGATGSDLIWSVLFCSDLFCSDLFCSVLWSDRIGIFLFTGGSHWDGVGGDGVERSATTPTGTKTAAPTRARISGSRVVLVLYLRLNLRLRFPSKNAANVEESADSSHQD